MPETEGAAGLSGEELETWSALATVLEWLPAALDASLQRDSDMTHFEYGILFALADAPDHRLRMSELAGFANSSLSRLSRAVSRLDRRGWVLRSPDPVDGRSTLATLTESGLTTYRSASPGHVQTVQRLVLDPLTRAQTRQLHLISRRIMSAIRDEEGWRPSPSTGVDGDRQRLP
ncbi:MarR family winged helix-turn-helix transcriptional regulator [Microbacterium sp. P01]|uniref:MarR family winged helix-turn-helix transcriptional regulator n=1 Tax=Microbacterium sp. P01 TaxID=3366261 RepID=UPI00366CC6E5